MCPYSLFGGFEAGVGKDLSFGEEPSFPFYAFDGVVSAVYQASAPVQF
jgi:hypothetical protein